MFYVISPIFTIITYFDCAHFTINPQIVAGAKAKRIMDELLIAHKKYLPQFADTIARLEEDNSRKDDKALNALVNKMLQDPYTPIRILALSALDSRAVTGDELTVGLLKQMQNSQGGYGQDAMQATETLLKMSGQKVEKEFEVKDDKKKTEAKKEEKTEKTQTK